VFSCRAALCSVRVSVPDLTFARFLRAERRFFSSRFSWVLFDSSVQTCETGMDDGDCLGGVQRLSRARGPGSDRIRRAGFDSSVALAATFHKPGPIWRVARHCASSHAALCRTMHAVQSMRSSSASACTKRTNHRVDSFVNAETYMFAHSFQCQCDLLHPGTIRTPPNLRWTSLTRGNACSRHPLHECLKAS
jgi:hypothetical protein